MVLTILVLISPPNYDDHLEKVNGAFISAGEILAIACACNQSFDTSVMLMWILLGKVSVIVLIHKVRC